MLTNNWENCISLSGVLVKSCILMTHHLTKCNSILFINYYLNINFYNRIILITFIIINFFFFFYYNYYSNTIITTIIIIMITIIIVLLLISVVISIVYIL